jgi:diguanylate cyclase (GGDEF)-like protein
MLFAGQGLQGRNFFECFEVVRPSKADGIDDIIALHGRKLHLRTLNGKNTALKGIGVPLEGDAGAVVDVSFGISVVEAIGDYNLTIGDFAATSLAVEMLYLLEAKSAAQQASKNLNTRLQGARIAAEEQAFTDTLTGLKNRRAMDHVLARFIGSDVRFGLMQIDLDYFKDVNDTMGHAAGDHVLQEVARILVDETRDEDLVARVGGDEFVVVFNKITKIKTLNAIARRIIDRMEVPILFNGENCRISASIGTTISDYYSPPAVDQMLADADKALYASKNRGRACFTVFGKELLENPALGEPPKGR